MGCVFSRYQGMMMAKLNLRNQSTIASRLDISGMGVHSGEAVSITLHPSDANTGIVFSRTDLPPNISGDIKASYENVVATELCTVIGTGRENTVATIEHLMAALTGMAIDNVLIEIDGPEVPVMDGSSIAFVDAIRQAGTRILPAARRYLEVIKPIHIEQGQAHASLLPHEGTAFDTTIDFDTNLIGVQRISVELTVESFAKELARARTFGRVEDVEKLWTLGYARGSSLENSVAIAGDRVLNPEGTRWPDEFVRHKALDAVGDLALAGYPILGAYRSHRGGHKVNAMMVQALMEDRTSWRIVEEPTWRSKGHAALTPAIVQPAFDAAKD